MPPGPNRYFGFEDLLGGRSWKVNTHQDFVGMILRFLFFVKISLSVCPPGSVRDIFGKCEEASEKLFPKTCEENSCNQSEICKDLPGG